MKFYEEIFKLSKNLIICIFREINGREKNIILSNFLAYCDVIAFIKNYKIQSLNAISQFILMTLPVLFLCHSIIIKIRQLFSISDYRFIMNIRYRVTIRESDKLSISSFELLFK